jgi:hypothetical protein
MLILINKGGSMKRIIILSSMIIGLTIGYGYAMEMGMMGNHGGHGNMGGSEQTGMYEMKDGHQGQSGHGEMMQWQGMSHHMIPMMESVNGMTQRMSEIMEKDMTPEAMKEMSALMRDVSKEMGSMADLMQKGSATEEEMHKLHMKINETDGILKERKN